MAATNLKIHLSLGDGAVVEVTRPLAQLSNVLASMMEELCDHGSGGASSPQHHTQTSQLPTSTQEMFSEEMVTIPLPLVTLAQWRLLASLLDHVVTDSGFSSYLLSYPSEKANFPSVLRTTLLMMKPTVSMMLDLVRVADHLDVPTVLHECVEFIVRCCRYPEDWCTVDSPRVRAELYEDVGFFFDLFADGCDMPLAAIPFAQLSALVIAKIARRLSAGDVRRIVEFQPALAGIFDIPLEMFRSSAPLAPDMIDPNEQKWDRRCATSLHLDTDVVWPITSAQAHHVTTVMVEMCGRTTLRVAGLMVPLPHQMKTADNQVTYETLDRMLQQLPNVNTLAVKSPHRLAQLVRRHPQIKHIVLPGGMDTVVFSELTAVQHVRSISLGAGNRLSMATTRLLQWSVQRKVSESTEDTDLVVSGLSWRMWHLGLDATSSHWLTTDANANTPLGVAMLRCFALPSSCPWHPEELLQRCIERHGLEETILWCQRHDGLRWFILTCIRRINTFQRPLTKDIDTLFRAPLFIGYYMAAIDETPTPGSTFAAIYHGVVRNQLDLCRAYPHMCDIMHSEEWGDKFGDDTRQWPIVYGSPPPTIHEDDDPANAAAEDVDEPRDHLDNTWYHLPQVREKIYGNMSAFCFRQHHAAAGSLVGDDVSTGEVFGDDVSVGEACTDATLSRDWNKLHASCARNVLGLTPLHMVLIHCQFGDAGDNTLLHNALRYASRGMFTADMLAWLLRRSTPNKCVFALLAATFRDTTPQQMVQWRCPHTGDNLLHLLVRQVRLVAHHHDGLSHWVFLLLVKELCALANKVNHRGVTPLQLASQTPSAPHADAGDDVKDENTQTVTSRTEKRIGFLDGDTTAALCRLLRGDADVRFSFAPNTSQALMDDVPPLSQLYERITCKEQRDGGVVTAIFAEHGDARDICPVIVCRRSSARLYPPPPLPSLPPPSQPVSLNRPAHASRCANCCCIQ